MHLPSPEAVPSLFLGMPSSTAPLLKAAADAVRERGWMQGAALGERAGWALQPADGWRQQLPAEAGRIDRLSLLLCSQELLGHVTGCIAEEASLGYRNL